MNELYRDIANALASNYTLTVREDFLASIVVTEIVRDVANSLANWDDEFDTDDFFNYVKRRSDEIYLNV